MRNDSFTVRAAIETVKCNVAGVFPDIAMHDVFSPLTAALRVTHRCTSRCISCNLWTTKDGKELTTDEWKNIILALRDAGFLQLAFTGGDVLLREDIFELLYFGVDQGMRVRCAVNGHMVTEKRARQLMETKLRTIALSLDGLDDTFEAIRGVKNVASRTVEAIERLKSFDNGVTKIVIAATIMKSTLPTIRPVVEYAVENNFVIEFNLIDFTHYLFETPGSKEQYELNVEEKEQLRQLVHWLAEKHRQYPKLVPRLAQLEWARNYFDDYRQLGTPCYQVAVKVCVEPDGGVRTCCSKAVVGNLMTQSVREVLGSPKYMAQVKQGIVKDCPGCSCRYNLSLNANFSSYVREGLLQFGLAKPL